MKPASFDYVRPASVAEAIRLVAETHEPRLLAGGQSLVPMLNMRLVQPAAVIDINGLTELANITVSDGELRVGALTRYSTLERSEEIRRHIPFVADAVRYVGDRLIRNRGTIGGSLAQGDPSGEMPLAAVALEARVRTVSVRGSREIPAASLFEGPYQVSLHHDEMITEVVFPAGSSTVYAFEEQARRHGDYAVLAVGAVGQPAGDGSWDWVRLVLGAAASTPLPVDEASGMLTGTALNAADIERAVDACMSAAEPQDDARASAAYRRHLIPVYVRRVLRSLRASGARPA